MTHKLEMLKGVLVKTWRDGSRNIDFREALDDGIYACSLSEAALNVLMHNWSVKQIPTDKLSDEDKQYQQGVQFVADEWDKILSEDGEGEGL